MKTLKVFLVAASVALCGSAQQPDSSLSTLPGDRTFIRGDYFGPIQTPPRLDALMFRGYEVSGLFVTPFAVGNENTPVVRAFQTPPPTRPAADAQHKRDLNPRAWTTIVTRPSAFGDPITQRSRMSVITIGATPSHIP